jgi:polysaccharide export outer membrane protein
MRKLIYLLFGILPFLYSCKTLNPSIMFQTSKSSEHIVDSIHGQSREYLIAEEDNIVMRIFTNEGFRLVDATQGVSGIGGMNEAVQYLVESDGGVKLPLLGKVYIKGMTIQQAEKMLEEKYSAYYKTPYVTIRVSNRHVLVFTGDGGKGSVISLQNENTTILEALTLAGGIESRGKAYKIKIIRGDLKNPQIFLVDLSTVEGMKKSHLIVQSKDIIYVEPSADYSTKVLAQLTPIIGILTSVLLIVDILSR